MLDISTDISISFRLAAIPQHFGIAITHTLRKILTTLIKAGNDASIAREFISGVDKRTLQSWNSNALFLRNDCLHHLVNDSVNSVPGAEAVCAWDGVLTYQELDSYSTSVAQHLISIGVCRGTFVPFAFEKSCWTVVAMLAALKAGGAFVPLDPEHPPSRIKEICDDVDAKIILTSNSYGSKFRDLVEQVVVVCPETVAVFQEQSIDDFKFPSVHPSDPVLVLFTSGSTGRPKGIIQEHRAICTHTLAHGEELGYHNARVLQFSAYTWDVAVIDIFTTLTFKGCVCIPSEEDRKFDVTRVIRSLKVELALLTPSFASLIDPESVPTLRTLILAGEALKQDVMKRWAGKVTLFNAFGPAEVGFCTINKVDPNWSRAETVGLPSNSSCWLVDPADYNKLVPIGAIGELVVAGPSMAREYLNDPTKTSSSFIIQPSWADATDYQRYYKTGDLLKYNLDSMDGSFDFVGRRDLQIKRHGQRMELGEVEHHLSKIPNVGMSMVAAPKEGCFQGDLVAIVQLRETGATKVENQSITVISTESLTLAVVIEQLSSLVPRYMLPSALLVVEGMPLTASMKLERRRVNSWLASMKTRPAQVNSVGQIGSLQPLENSESTAKVISRKAADMLGGKDCAYRLALEGHDFALQQAGVNSIQLISLSIFLQQTFGVKVPMSILLSSKVTIRTLASLIDQREQDCTDCYQKIDVLKETSRIIQVVTSCYENFRALNTVPIIYPPTRNVFLTGSTGYLGIEILRQLMEFPGICARVLVRDPSESKAMQRIIKRASFEGWWQDDHASRIQVWKGDLIKANLGLSDGQLECLRGESASDSCIHAIIQNGAHVHYSLDYETLQAANVGSTSSLLRLMAESRSVSSFVYVSGGQQVSADEDDDQQMAMHAESAGGYEQSKLMAELIVKRFASRLGSGARHLRIVKPGYIIGNANNGLANRSDFVWRLVAGCLEIGAYNEDEAHHWIFVADKARVAQGVLAGISGVERDSSQTVVKLLEGLFIADFWNVLREDFGFVLEPLPYAEWLKRMRATIMAGLESHPLFPVLYILERGSSIIGSKKVPAAANGARMKEVVRSNVKYLIGIGVLPTPEKQRMLLRTLYQQ